MSKRLFSILVTVSFLLVGATAFAQPRLMAVSPEFKGKIDSSVVKLRAIESHIASINSKKIVKIGDAEALEKKMYAYAEEMKAASDVALREAQKAGESNGREGNVRSLRNLEDTSRAHELKVIKLARDLESIETRIKVGTIKLDKPLLQQMTPEERTEFRKFLAPAGVRVMERLHPELFKPGVSPGSSLNLFSGQQAASGIKSFCNAFPDNVGNFFVRDAEAALAAPCVAVCLAKNWSGCVTCVVGASAAAVTAWNEFVKCWNDACGCKWYRPGCCAKKAWCLAKFIAKLA